MISNALLPSLYLGGSNKILAPAGACKAPECLWSAGVLWESLLAIVWHQVVGLLFLLRACFTATGTVQTRLRLPSALWDTHRFMFITSGVCTVVSHFLTLIYLSPFWFISSCEEHLWQFNRLERGNCFLTLAPPLAEHVSVCVMDKTCDSLKQ